jgi:hypothetical protein
MPPAYRDLAAQDPALADGGGGIPHVRDHGVFGVARTFDRVGVMDLVGRWWNGQYGRLARRDTWLTSDGRTWHVRARQGRHRRTRGPLRPRPGVRGPGHGGPAAQGGA